jgi:membrane protease YdiL (CAAX protease family)
MTVSVDPQPVPDSLGHSEWSRTALAAGLMIPLVQWLFALQIVSLPAVVPDAVFLSVAALLLLYPMWTRRKPPHAAFRMPSLRSIATEAAFAVPVVICCIIVNVLMITFFSWLWPNTAFNPERYESLSRSSITPGFLIVVLYSILYTPLAEEVFYRGFLLNAFRSRMSELKAMGLQAIIFAVAHGYGVGATLSVVILGLILSIVYRWRNSILTPVFVHAGFNATAFLSIIASMLASQHLATLGVVPDSNASQCVISTVVPDSPADEAGLKKGDVILMIDNVPIRRTRDLFQATKKHQPGDQVTVVFERSGVQEKVKICLVRREQIRSSQSND